MTNFHSLKRVVAVAAALLAGAALAQAPANDLCPNAQPVTPVTSSTVTTAAVNISAAATGVETSMACGSTAQTNSIWYTFVAPHNGSYTLSSCTVSNFDTVLQIYTGGSCGTLVPATSAMCSDDSCSTQSSVTLTLSGGTTYYVQIAAYNASKVTATAIAGLNITTPAAPATPPPPAPANDFCANATVINASATVGTTVASGAALIQGAATAPEVTPSCSFMKNDTWYTFVAPVSGVWRVDSCVVSNYDTVLAVYSGACGSLTPLVGGCNDTGDCSPASSTALRLVAGTTYYVQVASQGAATMLPTSAHGARVTLLSEAAGDVCSATSASLTLNLPTLTTTTSIDAGFSAALDDANVGGAAACFTGIGQTTSAATGRDVALQFSAPSAGRYSFRLTTPTPSTNAVLYLTDSCVPVTAGPVTYSPPQCVGASNRNTSADESVSCVSLTANQTVFVWVDESAASTAGSSSLLEVSRCTLETEPNNSVATANDLSCVMTGGIGTTTDVDFFALGAPPAGSRVFALVEAAAANATDFDLRVTTATRTIEYDDLNAAPAFGGSSGLIAGAVLTGEPSYLRVNYFSATAAEPYVLYSSLKTGGLTAEVEPNNAFASATTSATNYFTGSIQDGGNDVDVYAFNANAGDLIFAALDVVPDKTDAGTGSYNFLMSLIDSTNAVLLTVDDTSSTTTFGPTDGGLTASTPTFPAEGLVYRARTTGSYGIRIGKTSGLLPNPYNLSISVGCNEALPTLATVSPTSGTPSGGQSITLTGTNFNERSVVRFGTSIATVVSVTPTQLVVLSAANSPGDVSVSVTNAAGLIASLNPGYTYEDPPGLPPILTGVSPAVGPIAGGTVVTLTGTVFRPDAGVFFEIGGTNVAATAVTVNTTSRITATTPPHAEGATNVRVINFDALESTLPAAFTYQGPPTVSAITPNTGLTTGGQTITITGTNLRALTTVRIGATLATAVTPAADGLSLTAVTPTATANGVVDVLVRTTDNQSVTVTGGFTYAFPAPTITTVSPATGYAVGGQPISITGTGFLTAPTLTIGGAAATSVVRTSGTNITAVTPAGSAGLADVVVTNTDTQSVTRTGGFRYSYAPQISAISPVNGPVQGGTRITVTGQDFVTGATVRIGGVPAFAVTVTGPTTITAVTNANAAGLVNLVVTNPDLQAATLTDAFTFDGAPSLTAVSPLSGTTAGGTVVTLTGAGFNASTTVRFGATEATSVTRISNTQLTAVTPARAVGVVSVTVANLDGQSSELARAYRFVDPPMLSAVAPDTGDVAGGTEVHITGSGFSASSTVSFDGVPATQVSLVSGTELSAVSPAHGPGVVDVQVSTDGAIATLTDGFTYTRGAATVTSVAPASGPVAGGTLMTLIGTGFASGATITVGGNAATDVVIVSDVLARAVVPAHAAGLVDVVLTNDDAQAATLAGGFTYVAPLTENAGTVTDGGSGSIGEAPTGGGGGTGGISCGCSSFDGSMFSMAGFGLLMVLSRRRRRS